MVSYPWGAIIGTAIVGLLTALVIAILFGSKKGEGRIDRDRIVVEYSGAYRAFPTIIILFWVGFFTFVIGAGIAPIPTARDLPAVAGILLVIGLPMGIWSMEAFGRRIWIGTTGLDYRSPFFRRTTLGWKEIESVDSTEQGLIIRGAGKLIRVPSSMDGLYDLATALSYHERPPAASVADRLVGQR